MSKSMTLKLSHEMKRGSHHLGPLSISPKIESDKEVNWII